MTLEQLPLWASLPASIFLVVGGVVALIGSIGLLRFKDFYARMHAPTMCTTLGTGCVLVASMLMSAAVVHRPVVHELLITLFIVLTAPMTAIVLMRAARRRPRR